jgi:Domain of unknown function (DUF4276)
MPLSHIEILVEEASMETALRELIPKLVGPVGCAFQRFQGKPALLRQMPERLRTLRRLLGPDWLVLVVVDRDRADCRQLKMRLEQEAAKAGLATRTNGIGGRVAVVNRIVIEELEAWYFGDWCAVTAAYPRLSAGIPGRMQYRDPDAIAGGTWEAFERVLQQGGYFPGGLRKIEAAQAIAPHMDPARNTSRSFQVFRAALLQAVTP